MAICGGWQGTSGVEPGMMIGESSPCPRAARGGGEGQGKLHPFALGRLSSCEGRREGTTQPPAHPLCPHGKAQTALLWRAGSQREGGSCVNPRCVLGLLGFCLSNASGLCCLQSLCAATVIAALCLVQATLLGLSLLGRFQVTVTYKGKCFSSLLFPCHVGTDTEINGAVVGECSLHLPS